MKRIIFLLPLALCAFACTSPQQEVAEEPEPEVSSVVLPYTATYTTNINQDVSDADLLTVLDSYKSWETGDMQALRSAFGDSIRFDAWDGFKYNGLTEGLMDRWAVSRDSLSDITIEFSVWQKAHAIDQDADYIDVYYKEVDTYKSGKVDSAAWHDINGMKDGKIIWYAQYRRALSK